MKDGKNTLSLSVNRVSHSAIKDYQACPLLFLYRKVLQLELPTTSIHLHFGKALHLGLEKYELLKEDPKKVFLKAFTQDELDENDKRRFVEFSQTGVKMLQQYISTAKERNWKVTAAESKIVAKDIEKPAKLLFSELSGVIDFETDDGSIGDYKTSSHKYKQQEVDESLQPTFYYLLKYIHEGKLPKRFIYVVFNKKRKRDMIQVLETHRTMKDIVKLIHLMNNIHEKVEKQMFSRLHGEKEYCDCFKYEEMLNTKNYVEIGSREMVFN